MSITRSVSRVASFGKHLSFIAATSARHMSIPRPASSSSPTFPVTPPPSNPLREDYTRTAACLIIGDEVLNGKTKDSNSHYLAGLLFEVGIDLRRIEVVPDAEEDIIEAARRLVEKYDFVVTSGGIGPTHDDITYESLAKAFDPEGALKHDPETLSRMHALSEPRYNQNPDQLEARKRMALFPTLHSEVLFVEEGLWVPVVRIKKKLCVLPGVPTLFERLATALVTGGYVPLPPSSEKPHRFLVTTLLPESTIAPFLTSLAQRLKPDGIKVGSYPQHLRSVTVSLIGKDEKKLEEIVEEVKRECQATSEVQQRSCKRV